jgi:hypothetical protein
MDFDSSRRRFLKAGLTLPAAGLVAPQKLKAFFQSPEGVAYRTLGKTGLKVSAVGSGVGITPDPEVIARAIALGVNYFDTGRMYGEGNDGTLYTAGRKDALRAKPGDPSSLLPHVLPVQGEMPEWRTGHRRIAFPGVSRFCRQPPPSEGELHAFAGGNSKSALPGLLVLRYSVS